MGSDQDNGTQQVELLRAIWSEMKALRETFSAELATTRSDLGAHIDQTNERLDAVRAEIKGELTELREELTSDSQAMRRRMTESEVRLATATTQLAGEVDKLGQLVRDWRKEHREDRADLRTRVGRIEQQLGLTPRP
jgi:outer membrane murein-binding lipoprotein Lpp